MVFPAKIKRLEHIGMNKSLAFLIGCNESAIYCLMTFVVNVIQYKIYASN